MLEAFRTWLNGGTVGAGEVLHPAPGFHGNEDRRDEERFWFAGGEVFLFLPSDVSFRLRLRDVSTHGLSGLTDAPLSVGELVLVQFEETMMPGATVTWTRNSWVGLSLVNAIPEVRLRRLCERHKTGAAWSPAMRSASDLHNWWTDLEQVSKGRRTRFARSRA
jgi:hypothetical protein